MDFFGSIMSLLTTHIQLIEGFMKKFNIVSADGLDPNIFQKLKNNPNFSTPDKAKLNDKELEAFLPEVEGLIIRSKTKPNKSFIDRCPNLKYIIRAGEGTDNIDKWYCQTKGIKVSNTPGANNNSAAEHALALTLTTLRHTANAHKSMIAGNWDKSKFLGNELTNKTIGIVGFGRIGQLYAKRVQGFDPEILFFDPNTKTTTIPNTKRVETLEEIFKKSDIVTIHVPLNDHTRGLVNKSLLNLMPAHAILINAARGGIVNEKDLYKALKENKIRGAGLDVFETEPLAVADPLRSLDNTILTPHLGGSTVEAQYRVGEMALNQIKEFFLNNSTVNEVRS